MIVVLGVGSVIAVFLGVAAIIASCMAAAEECFGVAITGTILGLSLFFGGLAGAEHADSLELAKDCKALGENYMAKTKVINDECRFHDPATGRWLDEDAWLYATGLDNQ